MAKREAGHSFISYAPRTRAVRALSATLFCPARFRKTLGTARHRKGTCQEAE